MKRLSALFMVLALVACDDDSAAVRIPPPVTPDREATTYFGHMILVDHMGPKAQILLKGQAAPLWFPAVRDARAFTLLPDEAKDIVAIYVADMARATDWAQPVPDAWVLADLAVYVIGGSCRGGMGAPEPVPFSDPEAATAFAQRHGGRVVAWADIGQADVLGDAMPMASDQAMPMGAGHMMPMASDQTMPMTGTMPTAMPMDDASGGCAADFPVKGGQ